ncbi:ABC transporter ATP-binding protein [Paenibacillus flagellatus]|uniref:ABC transporter n=1 Tax=Paenibacillus flagellatus TaxID=2211139 RepID=A0A2V5K1M6_9BACL|nr:ATP-binding cassette domain-containing protein [Paenibacillus flagellatus]PYI53048.1 ABC transporter [Paenibacillus flagellatus]
MNELLTLEGVSKRRPDHTSDYLFRHVTATVNSGERIAVVGASGQGKSTLLRLLARLDVPDEGAIKLRGKPVGDWKPPEWRRRVVYVAQQPVMLPGTVEANLRTASELHGTPFDRTLAERCMTAVGLEAIDWRKAASELSGGEKQRTALVRCLLALPDALLLDETTASLDPASKRAVEELLLEWTRERGTAYLWVTHDWEQARNVSDSVWFMDEGTLCGAAETDTFFREPPNERARSFIRSAHGEGGAG